MEHELLLKVGDAGFRRRLPRGEPSNSDSPKAGDLVGVAKNGRSRSAGESIIAAPISNPAILKVGPGWNGQRDNGQSNVSCVVPWLKLPRVPQRFMVILAKYKVLFK